jgi:RNA polymerase sigma-70 factor (ECF subfamily)
MIDDETLKSWFVREVFPLEAALTRYIRRNWRNESDVADLRQEIYARIYSAAGAGLPLQPKPFLFATARNHLINKVKREQIVSIELVADLETSVVAIDTMTPDRYATARDELRRVQAGLDQLPPRCREVVMLRRIDGLSTREVAERLNIARTTVEQQMVHGMRALIDFMLGGSGKVRRPASKRRNLDEGAES